MRLDDWPQRLSAVVEASREKTFAYGVHDCGLFAADCVEALIGRDVAAHVRGAYGEGPDGLALFGVGKVADIPGRFFKRVAPSLAQRGDIAAVLASRSLNGRRALMLMVFDGAFVRGPAGAVLPRSEARRAWRVE